MPEPNAGDIFHDTYQMYLKQLRELDLASVSKRMGVQLQDGAVPVHLFGGEHHVSGRGIAFPEEKEGLMHAEIVVLCKYVILYPEEDPEGDVWVTFKDFKNAAPFVGGFSTNAEQPISKTFSGRLDQLSEACSKIGGREPITELSYDLIRTFPALPQVPLMLLFNDADEEFPAEAAILFEQRAHKFLDTECLAILGWLLSNLLHKTVGLTSQGPM